MSKKERPPKARAFISIRIDHATLRALDALARQQERSRNGMIRIALREFVAEAAKRLGPWDLSEPRRGRPRKAREVAP